MPSRPVAQKFTFTTGTGSTFGPAYFGTGMEWGAIQMNNTSTQSVKGSVQYSLGGSGVWVNLITLTSASTGSISLHVQSTGVFDRLRVNLTANELSSTGSSGHSFWLGAR